MNVHSEKTVTVRTDSMKTVTTSTCSEKLYWRRRQYENWSLNSSAVRNHTGNVASIKWLLLTLISEDYG